MLAALHIRRSVVREMEIAEIALGIITVVLEIVGVERDRQRQRQGTHQAHEGPGPGAQVLVVSTDPGLCTKLCTKP